MTTAVVSEKLAAFLAPLGIPSNPFQKAAYDQLVQLDFPTTKNEYWKYTRTGKIQNSAFQLPSGSGGPLSQIDPEALLANHYVVIENGVVRDDLSHYKGSAFRISVSPNNNLPANALFNSTVDQQHLFSALNTTYFNEVIEIHIASNEAVEEPLQLLFISTGEHTISNPRLLIHAGKSSSATIMASFASLHAKGSLTNMVTEFFVDENATLTYDKIQNEDSSAFHISTEQVTQAKSSTFTINTITLDGGLVRNNINIAVRGENCMTHMNGVVISKENQHVDNHTFVDHQVANCISNESYKYVLDGKSTGVFNGRVIVRKDAQKINAYQKNANVLLSDFAQINSKPELEIYADDVKCSHGSTTGQLDENAVFYLQTRGLSKDKAKKMLVSAFIAEITERFSTDRQQDYISAILRDKHAWSI